MLHFSRQTHTRNLIFLFWNIALSYDSAHVVATNIFFCTFIMARCMLGRQELETFFLFSITILCEFQCTE